EGLGGVEGGHIGLDGAELAAELRRGVRLEVVHVEVARPAAQPEENHRGVLGGLAVRSRRGLEPQMVGETEPGQSEEAGAEEATAAEAIAGAVARSENVEHVQAPLA